MSYKGDNVPDGYTAPGFEDVRSAFKEGFLQGFEKGASVSVYYKGSLAVNLWGGAANEHPEQFWKEDTMGFFYSGAKFLTGVVIASLVEKGLLNYEDNVSKYWPEFAQNGKEGIKLHMLMSHTAGLSFLDEEYNLRWVLDKPRVLTELLEKQNPNWEPETKVGYSNILVGLYLNEIVRRVDPKQRNVSRYFREEIAEPYSLDLHIGLPKTLHYRTPHLFWPTYSKEEIKKWMADFKGDIALYKKNRYQPKDWNSRLKLNDPEFARLPIPSSHAIGTSKAVAKLAGIVSNGGQYECKTLLSHKMIENLQKPTITGTDCISGQDCIFGLGTMHIPIRQGNKTWYLFGHSGFGGQMILADPVKKFGFAYCTNYSDVFSNLDNNKWKHLLESVFACIQKLEGNLEKIKYFTKYSSYLEDSKEHSINNSKL